MNNNSNRKKPETHLPVFGVGPVYGISVIVLTVISMFLSLKRIVYIGLYEALQLPFIILGILLIVLGIFMWIQAVIVSKLDKNIMENKLVTTGIYAWVRNPIYSAISIACTGALLISRDIWLLVLPLLFWLGLTILMKCTEEKWLAGMYDKEYTEYCSRVNRCIPWFPKKEKR